MKKIVRSLYNSLIAPKSQNLDTANREFIFNILLVGIILLAFLALILASVNFIHAPVHYKGMDIRIIFVVLVFFIFLLVLSRINKSRYAAVSFIGIFLLITFYSTYRSGVDLPQGLLIYAVIIIVSGIILNSNIAFALAVFIGMLLLAQAFAQESGGLIPQYSWKNDEIKITDIVVNAATLIFIALVSWLFNTEREKALRRARNSEAALKRQRDKLEITVEKRTRELQKAQNEKLDQLYHFAEFGQLTSGLFHDLVTPLNLISLNLNKLQDKRPQKQSQEEIKTILKRANLGTQQLEKFITAARKQIQNQEILESFSLKEEINQSIQMLQHKAKSLHVHIDYDQSEDIHTFGNPIKFSKVITNIIRNGIEAYEGIHKKSKAVEINMKKNGNKIVISVHDWGSGIETKNLDKIFDPLFTTKTFEKGTGIGLSISKNIVEKDFSGSIHAESTKKEGTIFTIIFPVKSLQRGKILKEKKI